MNALPLESNASYVAAQETIREKRHSLRKVAGYLLPDERVKRCGCYRHSQTVDIHRTAKGAHFVGVETCGSVWHCPVCASRISETRREEVAQVIDAASESGGASYMLTLTMRHNRSDKLAYLKGAIADGWRKAQNRRAYRTFKARYGIWLSIRLIIPKQRLNHLRLTVSVKGSTEPFWTSFTELHSERNSTKPLNNYKGTWMTG